MRLATSGFLEIGGPPLFAPLPFFICFLDTTASASVSAEALGAGAGEEGSINSFKSAAFSLGEADDAMIASMMVDEEDMLFVFWLVETNKSNIIKFTSLF